MGQIKRCDELQMTQRPDKPLLLFYVLYVERVEN